MYTIVHAINDVYCSVDGGADGSGGGGSGGGGARGKDGSEKVLDMVKILNAYQISFSLLEPR